MPEVYDGEADLGERLVCAACIGAARFSDWIEANGKRGTCDFKKAHGRSYIAIEVERLAVNVDEYFRETYQLGEEYPVFEGDSDSPTYQQRGDPYQELLAEELECEPEIVEALSSCLPDASHRDIAQGDTPFYDETLNYERIADAEKRDDEEWREYWYENRFHYQWQDFCSVVQFERRFFKIKELLDELFGSSDEYGGGVIKPMYAMPAGTKIFRARMIDHEFSAEMLAANPARELSAPPKERARAGRMNVEYIPAFYGAFCEETAIAEIRPGIGDQIAVGEFTLSKEIKVFDFTAFSRKGADWTELVSHTRYDFIDQMEDEISKPISPFVKQREYIPTQIVAEYLREHFNCDAVIYKSSMQRDAELDNRNVVIFNRRGEFAGQSSENVLTYVSYDLKEIFDVKYRFGSAVPF